MVTVPGRAVRCWAARALAAPGPGELQASDGSVVAMGLGFSGARGRGALGTMGTVPELGVSRYGTGQAPSEPGLVAALRSRGPDRRASGGAH